jgi:hypothetical protein
MLETVLVKSLWPGLEYVVEEKQLMNSLLIIYAQRGYSKCISWFLAGFSQGKLLSKSNEHTSVIVGRN